MRSVNVMVLYGFTVEWSGYSPKPLYAYKSYASANVP